MVGRLGIQFFLFPWGLGCGASEATLRLGAAASLSDVLPPLIESAQDAMGVPVEVVYGGSGELAAQLRHGAELDVLFLASEHPIVELQRVGLLGEIEGPMIRNSLVLTGSSSLPASTLNAHISEAERICIGTLGVPAGDYARIWLEEEGLSPDSLIEFGHVRAVLAAVESGSCDLGFVYATDLREASSQEVLARWESSPRYAFARASGAPEAARSLGIHLHEGRAEFEKAGFVVESP